MTILEKVLTISMVAHKLSGVGGDVKHRFFRHFS